jgi:hypothetical protein
VGLVGDADADADADADPAAGEDEDVPTGSFGPPGLAATVPQPAASAPATSRGTERARVCFANRVIDAIEVIM